MVDAYQADEEGNIFPGDDDEQDAGNGRDDNNHPPPPAPPDPPGQGAPDDTTAPESDVHSPRSSQKQQGPSLGGSTTNQGNAGESHHTTDTGNFINFKVFWECLF